MSPEAALAAKTHRAAAHDLPAQLAACASGRELHDAGFAADVDVAAEIDRGTSVPVLKEQAFLAA